MSEYLGNLQYSSTGYGVGSGSACLALHWDTLGFTRAKLPICAAFCSGSGLRTCNSQTCGTCFRISDLRYQVQILRLTNYSHWDSCWSLFMGVKYVYSLNLMVIQIKSSQGLEIIARWGLSHSVCSSGLKEVIKWEMLSLARTSKYVNNT